MTNGWIKYLTLFIFLAGVLLIVFLQFNSGSSINLLIRGNRQLQNELTVRNKLQTLVTSIVTYESKTRGSVISNKSSEFVELRPLKDTILRDLEIVETAARNTNTASLLTMLDSLVKAKIFFNEQVEDSFLISGKQAAEGLIRTEVGVVLREEIFTTVRRIDSTRQDNLVSIINSIEHSGIRARALGITLAVIAGVIIIIALFFIVNQGREQQKLIGILHASERKIRDAAVIKEQFMANMSHEIRTPMNAILGFTNLLQKTRMNEDQQQFVQNIQSSGENLLAIVNDILDLSKIEAGMMRIEEAPFSLHALINSVETMFREKAKQKKLELEVRINEDVPEMLSGDAVRLTQILVNLLGNGLKFTAEGGITVSVNLASRNELSARIRFSIADTGIGIAPHKQAHIFERFHQAETETTRRFGGTGLGLSIVKELVEMQQGSIEVKSGINQGTEFIVELPYKVALQPGPVKPESILGDNLVHFSPDTRVLIAEDNQMNQQLIRHLMKSWQLNFELVENGREAVDTISRNKFDLVLMDIQMPEMDGYVATKKIRTSLGSEVPIIAMTAHAMAGEKEKCIGYGMNDYISKPIKEEELYKLIQQYTNSSVNHIRPSNMKLINLDYLHELSKNDWDFEKQIIRQFTIQAPEELKAFETAIAEGDFKTIHALSHNMKSSVSFMGLNSLLQVPLQEVENDAEKGKNIEGIRSHFEKIKSICQQAIEEARQLLA